MLCLSFPNIGGNTHSKWVHLPWNISPSFKRQWEQSVYWRCKFTAFHKELFICRRNFLQSFKCSFCVSWRNRWQWSTCEAKCCILIIWKCLELKIIWFFFKDKLISYVECFWTSTQWTEQLLNALVDMWHKENILNLMDRNPSETVCGGCFK